MSTSAAPAQGGENAPAAAKPVKEKKICRTIEGGTTSRMHRRVCRTVKQWDEANEEADVSAQRPGMRSR